MESRGEPRVVGRPGSQADGGGSMAARRRALGRRQNVHTREEACLLILYAAHASIRESGAPCGGPGLGRRGRPWSVEDAGGVRRRARGRSARTGCAGSKGAWGACGLRARLGRGLDAEKGRGATRCRGQP
jgi:hypothetical protein